MSHVLGMVHIEKEAKEDLEKMLLSPYAPRRKSLQRQLDSADFNFFRRQPRGMYYAVKSPLIAATTYHHARWRCMQHEHAAKEIMVLPQEHAQMESDALLLAPVDIPF